MENFSIILSSLSAITVIIAILFDGKFKSEKKNKSKWFVEFSHLTKFGWILIIFSLLTSAGNGIHTYITIVQNNKQHVNDTINNGKLLRESYKVNHQLRDQKKIDSMEIDTLKKSLKINGVKTDLIKNEVVNNAVKALEEQRKIVERERENVFVHLQKEIKDNLGKILFEYDEENIRSFKDTSQFLIARLSDTYIKQYNSLSNNKKINEPFTDLSERMKYFNFFADNLISEKNKEVRKDYINQLIGLKKEIYNVSLKKVK